MAASSEQRRCQTVTDDAGPRINIPAKSGSLAVSDGALACLRL